MPKFFDTLKDIGSEVLDTAGNLGEDVLYANEQLHKQGIQQGFWKTMAADEWAGTQLARIAGNRHVGPVNIEDVLGQVLRPSNLVPVSKASELLKARAFGPPLLRALAREGAFAGGFSAAETARKGGSGAETATSALTGGVMGALTPLGFEGAGTLVSRVRGLSRTAPLIETAPATIARKARSRFAANPEDVQTELTKPRSLEEGLASLDKTIASTKANIGYAEDRIANPIGERPAKKKSGVYAGDLLTAENGKRYPLRLLQADAGEMEARPVISAGGFKVGDKSFSLTVQEAKALEDLYAHNASPTLADVRKELEGVSAPVRVKKRGVEASAEGETAAELLGTKKVKVAKEAKPRSDADYKLIKAHIDTEAKRVQRPILRPDVAQMSPVKENLRALDFINYGGKDAKGNPVMGLSQVNAELEGLRGTLNIRHEQVRRAQAAAAKAGKPVPETPKSIQEHLDQIRLLEEQKANLLDQRARHLEMSTADVPLDPVVQRQSIIDRLGPQASNLPPALPPTVAADMLARYRAQAEQFVQEAKESLAKNKLLLASHEMLRDAMAKGETGGRVPKPLRGSSAAHNLRKWKEALAVRAKNPKGISRAAAGTEPLANFWKLAHIEAATQAVENPKRSIGVGRQIILNHQSILSTLPHELGARAFTEEGGARKYGKIVNVVKNGETAADWQVEMRPEIGSNRDSYLVPLSSVSLEYADKAIGTRYDFERGVHTHSRDVSQLLASKPETTGAGAELASLKDRMTGSPLSMAEPEVRSIEELDSAVQEASDAFQDDLMPLGPDAPLSGDARAKAVYDGWLSVMNAPMPRNKARAEELAAAQVTATEVASRAITERELMARLGSAIDDPRVDQAMAPDTAGMMEEFLYLRGKSLDPRMAAHESSLIPAKVRSAMRFISGQAFVDDRLKGINQQFIFHGAAGETNAAVHIDAITQALRQQSLDDMAKGPIKTGWDWRHPLSNRPHALRMANGDSELSAVLGEHYTRGEKVNLGDPRLAAAAPGVRAIAQLPEELRNEVHDFLGHQMWTLIHYPELFGKIPDSYKNIARYAQNMIGHLHEVAALEGKAAKESTSFANSMLIAPEYRDRIDVKDLAKSPLEVIAAVAQLAKADGKSVASVLATGDGLIKAEASGVWKSITRGRLLDQITKLKDPQAADITFGVGADITNLPGKFSIRSLDKFKVRDEAGVLDLRATKDLQDGLKHLEQNLNSYPDWKGFSKVSQTLANMVLSMDLNLATVQGYSAMASHAVFGLAGILRDPVHNASPAGLARGAKAMGAYIHGVHQVMSDEGFHAWYSDPERFSFIQQLREWGLTTGAEAFTGGYRLNKIPLEHVPFAGNLIKLGMDSNDLQFNRWLLYLKVTAIESQMDKAKTFRAIGHAASLPWLRGAPGLADVVKEAGGEQAYMYGLPEDTMKAIVRTVNNKLGGISMKAQGIGAQREIAEQLLTIVPGFFRAQAGQLTTALTRPHTVEGWLAASSMAEEVAFAGAIAGGLALMTGNTDKLNYHDMRRADWMAVPFQNSYVPLIPRMAIPRLLARTLSEVAGSVRDKPETPGEFLHGMNPGPALQSFAQGRLSPLISATLGPAFFDADFLGRRYRDKKDRIFAGLTHLMPIFAENIATDARENVAQSGWGALPGVAAQTPLQWLGKSVVPRPPVDKLNDIAKAYSSAETPQAPNRNWFDLTEQERGVLLQKPEVAAAQHDFDYYSQRRASDKSQQTDAAFQLADQRTTELRTQPINFPDGKTMTMGQAYDLLQAGQINGDDYRAKLQWVNGKIDETMHNMELRLKELGLDLNSSHEDKVKRLTELYGKGNDKPIQTQLAIWDSQRITPEQFQHEVTVATSDGSQTIVETDWAAFQAAKDKVMGQYPTDIQLAAHNATDKWNDPGIEAYRTAAKQRSAIEDMPRYKGLTNANADKLDAYSKDFTDLSEQVRAKIGLPGSVAPLPNGLSAALRAYAIKRDVKRGTIKTQQDLKIATLALAMAEKPEIKMALLNPKPLAALIQNPNVILFYPYLLHRIPVWLQGKLPANVQVWNQESGAQRRVAGAA